MQDLGRQRRRVLQARQLRLCPLGGAHPVVEKNPSRSAGCVSKLRLPSGSAIQGCLLRVQKCAVGRSQEVSSKVPARTFAEPGLGALLQIHEPHCGQTQRVITRPLSAVF